ncbi:MAG: hypothetical protein HKL95_10015 [Phycisphaerae bacterium]|nr:hypothetical protein [Phycisphaerae bacterium]
MDESQLSQSLRPGQRTLVYAPGSIVRVTEQIPRRTQSLAIAITGRVLRQERQASGSWFARNKGQRLWLDRLIIEKDDGEQLVLNLDDYTHVELLQGPPPRDGQTPMIEPAQDRTGSRT